MFTLKSTFENISVFNWLANQRSFLIWTNHWSPMKMMQTRPLSVAIKSRNESHPYVTTHIEGVFSEIVGYEFSF